MGTKPPYITQEGESATATAYALAPAILENEERRAILLRCTKAIQQKGVFDRRWGAEQEHLNQHKKKRQQTFKKGLSTAKKRKMGAMVFTLDFARKEFFPFDSFFLKVLDKTKLFDKKD